METLNNVINTTTDTTTTTPLTVEHIETIIANLQSINSFLYIIVFGLVGVFIFVLLYKFLKIFI